MSIHPVNAAFGKAIALRRDELSLTQAELASRVGMSRASIANIERGRQNVLLHHVYDLAAALKMAKVGDLLPQPPQPGIGAALSLKLSDADISPRSAAQVTQLVASVLAAYDTGKPRT